MAELLVLAFETFNTDPQQDLMAYKLGHIIDIKEDGHVWGTQEKLPKFWIIKVPGMAVADAQEYLKMLQDFTDLNNVKTIGIRKWKLDYNLLPAAAKNTLNSTGIVSVNKTTVLNYLSRITTG